MNKILTTISRPESFFIDSLRKRIVLMQKNLKKWGVDNEER